MLSTIITAENNLDILLPAERLVVSPSAELIEASRHWSQVVWDEAVRLGPMFLNTEQVTRGLELAEHPVFICGVHRSGTTLVKDLLDGHPELVVLPSEGTWYTNIEYKFNQFPQQDRSAFLGREWLRRIANPINQPPYWLLGRSTDARSPYVDFARYFMAWYGNVNKQDPQWPHMAVILAYASVAGRLTAKLWVDKTPVNERFLKRIWKEMPGAKIIQVIREPAAVLTSRKKMEPGLNVRRVLHDLRLSYRVALQQNKKNDSRFLLLRYEEICADAETTAKQITGLLTISNSGSLNVPTVAGRPAFANSSFKSKPAPGKILTADQHQQEELLTESERDLLTAYVGNLATKLYYKVKAITGMRKIYQRAKYFFLS